MSNPKGPTTKTLLIVGFLGTLIVAGLAAYVKFTPADRVPDDQRRIVAGQLPKPPPQVDISARRSNSTVLVFIPSYEGNELKFTTREERVPKDIAPEVFALTEFLKASRIPDENARVLGVDVRNGLAAVSFNSAFATGYGTDDEHTLLDGFRRSLGQFSAINEFELYVDGTRVETLGSVELSQPMPVIRTTTTDEAPNRPASR